MVSPGSVNSTWLIKGETLQCWRVEYKKPIQGMLVCTGRLIPSTAAATAAATSARVVVFFYVFDQWNERGCQDC